MATQPEIVSRKDWLEARVALLAEEKALTRASDALALRRQNMPWVKVTEDYQFDAVSGRQTLAELFDGRSQLVVQHFMFAPEWQEGCRSCSYWSDNLQGAPLHLAARDVTFVAVSQAPLAKLEAFKARMGWQHSWVSSEPSNFSNDYHAWYTPEQIASGETFYNFQQGLHYGEHAPGFSVFAKSADAPSDDDSVYHTYSCYARGLDRLNATYHILDMVPRGRDEQGAGMAWLKLHDQYQD